MEGKIDLRRLAGNNLLEINQRRHSERRQRKLFKYQALMENQFGAENIPCLELVVLGKSDISELKL